MLIGFEQTLTCIVSDKIDKGDAEGEANAHFSENSSDTGIEKRFPSGQRGESTTPR